MWFCLCISLDQYAGGFIKVVGLTINGAPALVHGTGVQVVIPALAILGVPAFDHSAVGVIPHPLAAVGILVYFLAYGFGTLLSSQYQAPLAGS